MQNDPLWTLRHALAGVAIALVLSVPIAALVGAVVGDWLGHSYGWRAALYGLLLVYVVAGTAVLFVKVARHEKRPLSVKRVGLWPSKRCRFSISSRRQRVRQRMHRCSHRCTPRLRKAPRHHQGRRRHRRRHCDCMIRRPASAWGGRAFIG